MERRIDSVAVPGGAGRIAMIPCPGTGGTHAGGEAALDEDLDALAAWGAETLVTLNEHAELEYLGLQMLPLVVRQHDLAHLHLPIRDMDVPGRAFERAWRRQGPVLRAGLRRGARVAVHCWAGLGRSGMIAARLLVELGAAPEAAIAAVRAARPGAIQTLQQEGHVKRCRAVAD